MIILKQGLIYFFILWLSFLTVLSTSHMGNSHYYSGSVEITICSTKCFDKSHHVSNPVCIWENAYRLLTAHANVNLTGACLTYQFTVYFSLREIFSHNHPINLVNRGPPFPSMI